MAIFADEALRSPAEILAHRLRAATGWPWPVLSRARGREESGIAFIADSSLEAEAYRLSITEAGATIQSADRGGALYGAETLCQLLPAEIYGPAASGASWPLPLGEIADAPRYRWRGLMLDSVRHFQSPAYIRKLIDLLSQHKMNILHWHLTDDQGWRIEIKSHPLLTERGGKRRETWVGHSSTGTGGDGRPVEGFYTQDEIRELVAYAAERNIQILPEIEMPGHAQAAIAAYPELGCVAEPSEVSCRWGIHEYLFNIQPGTLDFLRDVLAEVASLFPFEYVHLGGDEAVKAQWQNHEDTQQRMKELGVPNEGALQGWFLGQMAECLRTHGKKVVGWDEILEAELPPGATVMSWQGTEGAHHAAERGHDTIMCASSAYYFDWGQSETPEDEPLNIGGATTLEKVHAFDPLPPASSPALARHLIGLQAQLWTEYIPTTEHLEYMAFPRLCALAEAAWSGAKATSFANFRERLNGHLKRLDVQGVNYRRERD